MLMGSVGAGTVGRPEGPGMGLSGTQRRKDDVMVFLVGEELAIATATSSQAGETEVVVRGFQECLASRRDMGLGGRCSTVVKLRNGRQPTLVLGGAGTEGLDRGQN